jgi:hypothetical protein
MDVGTIRWGGDDRSNGSGAVGTRRGGKAGGVRCGCAEEEDKMEGDFIWGLHFFERVTSGVPYLFFIFVRKILWALHFIS